MGFRPDWGGAVKGGLEGIEAMLLENIKHKKRVAELQDKYRWEVEERERDREDTRRELGIGVWENVLRGDFNPYTKQKFTQWVIEQGWVDPGLLSTPTPAIPKAEFGTPEYWQQGIGGLHSDGYTPPDTGEVPRLFEALAVEPKPQTVAGDKRLFAPAPSKPKTPTPVAPEKLREQAYRLTTSIMRGPQFQDLLSGLDPKARIKFEKDFAQMLERTYKFLQAGQFPEMRRTEEEWDELYGE